MTHLLRHLQVLFDTLGRMWKTPLPMLATLGMLGIAMALPLMLHKLVDNLAAAAQQLHDRPRISLFLATDADGAAADQQAIDFGRELLRIPAIDDIEYISPSAAIDEFTRLSGFGDALDNLPENPLPPLLVVYPAATDDIEKMEVLAAQLAARDEVDGAIFDQQWLRRLAAILALFQRGVTVLAALMMLGVILIISNTVRLGIASRFREIEIIDQVGGSRAFIRRPFLYFGVLQGGFGALLACAIGNFGLWLLGKPTATLAALYGSDFRIDGLDIASTATITAAAAALGWAVARITVDWRLKQFYKA